MGKMNYTSDAAQRRIDRIQLVLRGQELSSYEISELIHLTIDCTQGYIRRLHAEQLIYISGYRRNEMRGNYLPLYRWGVAEDVPKPKQLSSRDKREALIEEDPMAHEVALAKRRAKKFQPHRDWAAAWVPTRSLTR